MLRFSNTIYNFGSGPLEVRPDNRPHGLTDAYQRLYSHTSTGVRYVASERRVGTFVFHRAHHHWHFERFALYELLADNNGSVGALLASNPKTTVCIRNDASPEPGATSLEHFGWIGGSGKCSKTATEGLTVGYGDTYTWTLAGQSIDITGFADGCYWLRSTANPDRLLEESDYSNNAALLRISIAGTTVNVGCP